METSKMRVLQLCGFSGYLEGELDKSFDRIPWHSFDDAQKAAMLAEIGASRVGIATGGHLGCSNALMDQLPGLGVIAINGVGFDKVDLEHARNRGVSVTTTPDVLTDDVADLAVGLIIGLLRKLPAAEQHVRQGKWLKGDVPLARKVSGKKFGILGLGRIGRAIADRLAPFGPVYYSDLSKKDCPYDYVADFLDLARACDVLILASAANDSNKGLISTGLFEALGPQGYVVNVARGSLVDESALIAAIENGVIAGAALDVYAAEPVVPTSLIESDKVMLTPHIASATIETRTAMADLVLANLRAYAAGEVLPTALV